DYGFDEITFPVELNRKELSHLNNPDGELVVYGKIPLMISANCIDKTCHKCHKPESRIASITDRKDAKLMYVSCCRYCYNVIYNSVPVFLLDKITDIKTVNPRNISLCFTDEGEDLVYEYVKLASDISKGKEGRAEAGVPALFTRGHFTRGVE
ncbi:MAG: U32 family peptidase, partial [Butyrivibrio sp.]